MPQVPIFHQVSIKTTHCTDTEWNRWLLLIIKEGKALNTPVAVQSVADHSTF